MVIFSTINMSRSRATFSSLHLDPPSCAISDFCGPNNTIVLTRTLYNPSHERRYHQYWCIVLRILLIANETVMRSIDIDSYICLASLWRSFPPLMSVPSAPPQLKITWRSFLGHRRMCYHQHLHSWPSKEVFFVFGECSIGFITIEDHLNKFSSPLVKVTSASPPLKITWRSSLRLRWVFHPCYHHWRSLEEVFFNFGECFNTVTTIEDHMKKFS